MTEKELEDQLFLASLDDKEVAMAKTNTESYGFLEPDNIVRRILDAIVKDASAEIFLYGRRQWTKCSTGYRSYADHCIYRLSAGWKRPVITPDDLPPEMCKRFNEGFEPKDATEIEVAILDHFHNTCPEMVEWKECATSAGWRNDTNIDSLPSQYRSTLHRLRPAKVEPKWRTAVMPDDYGKVCRVRDNVIMSWQYERNGELIKLYGYIPGCLNYPFIATGSLYAYCEVLEENDAT